MSSNVGLDNIILVFLTILSYFRRRLPDVDHLRSMSRFARHFRRDWRVDVTRAYRLAEGWRHLPCTRCLERCTTFMHDTPGIVFATYLPSVVCGYLPCSVVVPIQLQLH